eukprot:scaffold2204_cov166-Amphora_coffeaeformis.AAC.8
MTKRYSYSFFRSRHICQRLLLWWLATAVLLRQTAVPLVSASSSQGNNHTDTASIEDHLSQLLQQRFLQTDDDDSFVLVIPDITVETRVLGITVTIDLTDISCRDLSIDTITVDLQAPLANGIPVFLGLYGVNVTCQAAYEYQILFGSGQGVVELSAVDASIESSVVFVSPNLAIQPPNAVWFNECNTDITIERLEFDGAGTGVVAQALNAAEPLVTPLVEREMADALCEQIEDMEDEFATLLADLSAEWEPYWRGTTIPDSPFLVNTDIPVDALDLSNPSATNLGTLFDLVLDRTVDYLRETDDISGTLKINRLVQNNLVDPVTGDYTVDSFDAILGPDSSSYAVSTALGFLDFELQRIVVQGLGNAMQRIDAVDITGPFTLQTGLLLSNVTVLVDAVLTIRPLNGTTTITQALALDLPIERLDVQATAVVLTSETTLGNVKLGSLLDTDNIVGCVSQGFDKLGLAEIDVREFVLDPTSSFSTSTEWVSNIIESNVTVELLNTALEELLDGRECTESAADLEGTVDWRDLLLESATALDYGASGSQPYGDIGPLLKDYIDSVLLETDDDGYLGLAEQLIFPLTQSQSGQDGVWTFEDDLVNVDQDFDLGDVQASFELRLSDVRVENLASILKPTSIFDPIRFEAYRTFNQLTIGRRERPMRFAGTLAFAFETSDTQIRNEVNIQVELWDASLSTTLLLRMAEKYLMQFPLSSLLDIHCVASLLHTPELDARGVRLGSSQASFSLENLEVVLKEMRLSVDCISCTSPEVERISALLKDPENSKDAAAAIEDLIHFAFGLAENDESFLQLQIDRFLVNAAAQCQLREEYNPNFSKSVYEAFEFEQSSSDSSLKVLMIMVAVIGCIAVAAFTIVTVLRFIVSRRHRAWLETLPRSQLVAIYAAQQDEAQQEEQVNKNSTSLYKSPQVPVFLRYFIPFVMLCNIVLFLSGHFSLGGSVQIYIQLAGEKVVIDNFYKFSIVQSALELWDVGGVELAILIFLFSGVWPYSKILITMALWFAPPDRVSTRRRGSILMRLDTLGKWSMVDVFVMIITIVAFRVTIVSPDYSFLPVDFYKIDLVVAPLWGLYANMTAQLVTQISSHIIIYYHRKVEAAGVTTCLKHEESRITDPTNVTEMKYRGTDSDVESVDAPVALHESPFYRPHKGESDPLYVRSSARILVAAASIVLIVLLLLGFLLPSFSFENLGIVGIAIEFGQRFEQARRDYSIRNIARLVMEQGRFLGSARDALGHFCVVALLVASTLLVPYILIATLLFQLWYPFCRTTRRRLDSFIEGLTAWCYVDVYLLSVIVASWQVGDISEYLVNPYCGSLDSTFAELVSYNIVDEDDAQCFRVRSLIEPAIYALVVSAVMLSLLMSFVTNGYRQLEYQSGTLRRQQEGRNSTDGDLDLEDDGLRENIHLVPLLLTDRFRWLLRADKK